MSLRRRDFLTLAAGAAVGLSLEARAMPRARADARRAITVVLFLRGGLDGLSVLVPYGEPNYARFRPRIGIARPGTPNGALEIAPGFGLHPAMAPLLPMAQRGALRIAPAVGLRMPNRSHFEAQHRLEVGEDAHAEVGMLNAALATRDDVSGIAALCLSSAVPELLAGPALAVPVGDIGAFQDRGPQARRAEQLAELYRDAPGRLGEAGRQALEAAHLLTPGFASPSTLDAYPPGEPRGQLAQAARFIRADLGIPVFYCEASGWDTHANQGGATGPLATRLGQLAANLAHFFGDLGPMRQRVRLVAFTEFGRTVRENGSGGTDHGTASVMLTLGEGLGGPVIDGAYPGLADDALFEGRDLRTTRHLELADFGL